MPKTLFLFILRHPEGVMLHDLDNYRTEIHNLYLSLSRYSDLRKVRDGVKQLTDVANFAIRNTNICRVKENFVEKIADEWAKSYYIMGKRSEEKRIVLGHDFIEWESGTNRK